MCIDKKVSDYVKKLGYTIVMGNLNGVSLSDKTIEINPTIYKTKLGYNYNRYTMNSIVLHECGHIELHNMGEKNHMNYNNSLTAKIRAEELATAKAIMISQRLKVDCCPKVFDIAINGYYKLLND